jgi:hypothetical protein
MSYASLDYYFSNSRIPTHESKDFPNKKVPPDKSLLSDYIYKRSLDSFLNLTSYKFILWSLFSKNKRDKILHKCLNKEFPKLKKLIDMGNPVVLGLISASKISDIFINHQVVAYGYDYDSNDNIILYIYDNNSHDKEVTLVYDFMNKNFKASNNNLWQSFFVQNYHYKKPVYNDLNIIESIDEKSLKSKYIIENIGEFPSNLKYLDINIDYENKNKLVINAGEKQIFAAKY